MPQQIRCQCEGNPACQLCLGAGTYPYEPGPRGWMPFVCPTCNGAGYLGNTGEKQECLTCHRAGQIDPANPPMSLFTKIRKTFFGG